MPPFHPQSIVASSTKQFAKLHQATTHFASRFITTPVAAFIAWLSVHTHIAYLALFIGAYLDALIGPSLLIPGEVVFLSGSILAGRHVLLIWLVALYVYLGGILGDTTSYWIGRALGISLFHERKKFLNIRHYHNARKFVDKYGPKAIFFARLVGPFSKIAPTLAGILEIPFGTFLLYNIPGVLVGIGEFLLIGYIFGNRYELVLWLFERYTILFFIALFAALLIHWQYKKHRARKKRNGLRYQGWGRQNKRFLRSNGIQQEVG